MVEKVGIVSLLIPIYNHESTVERALESVLCSDCSKIELIVCDDASTDQSYERAAAWIDAHRDRFESVRSLRNPENLGITRNLNQMIGLAAGEFLTLFASDDELAENSVDLQRSHLQHNAAIDFVFANCGTIDPSGQTITGKVVSDRRARLVQRPTCSLVDIVFNWSLPWSRMFARRGALLKLGPYLEEHSFEDRWSTLMIARTKRYGYLHEVVYLYRLRPHGSGTAGIDQQRIFRDMRIVEEKMAGESLGSLRLLLQIHVRSASHNGRYRMKRLIWLAVRLLIATGHRLLVGR